MAPLDESQPETLDHLPVDVTAAQTPPSPDAEPDDDERLGEAIEAYLEQVESGHIPDVEEFAAGYPDLGEDLVSALEGLALVQGLVGDSSGGGPGQKLEAGRRLAGYRIVREIGRGGMGIVYEAVHVGLDRPVALKVLGTQAAPDSSGRRRFLNEAKTAAGLHHTNIVPVFDVGQVGGLCYYAMQRIEGSGLDRVVKHIRRDRSTGAGSTLIKGSKSPKPTPFDSDSLLNAPMLGDSTASWGSTAMRNPSWSRQAKVDEPPPYEPPRGQAYYRWVADIGRQAAQALGFAHQRGVIHRDVKPSNLLIDAKGQVWVADFGLARRLADPSQTQVDSLLGTPRYMSPEQTRAGSSIDGRTDVYSLGATLYELLTLRPVFEGQSAAELIDQITNNEPVPPRKFDPRIPVDLETILLKAMAKRPGDRYADAQDLADDLERFLNLEPVKARRIGPVGRLWRFARRHPSLTAVSTAATVVVLTTATVAYVKVLVERDAAKAARDVATKLNTQLETVNSDLKQSVGNSNLAQARLLRHSSDTGRRAKGLDLLKKASSLTVDPAFRTRLRDEALAFLAARDVVSRPPIQPEESQSGLVFGKDGKTLATLAGDNQTVTFWDASTRKALVEVDLRTGQPVEELPPFDMRPPEKGGGPGGRRGVGFGFRRIAAMGDRIAVVQADGNGVLYFDPGTGKLSGSLKTPQAMVFGVVASFDGRRLITFDRPRVDPWNFGPGGPDGPGTPGGRGPGRDLFNFGSAPPQIHLWDPAKPDAPLATLAPPEIRSEAANRGGIPLVAIAPDSSEIAIAWREGSDIALFDRQGRAAEPLTTQTAITALALGQEGILAAAGGGSIRLWDANRNSLPDLSNQTTIQSLRFSPVDGSVLAASGFGSAVELWDLNNHNLITSLPVNFVADLGFSPGADRTLAISQFGRGQAPPISLWELTEPVAQVQLPEFGSPPMAVSYSPDGTLLVLAQDTSVHTWMAGNCPSKAEEWPKLRSMSLGWDPAGKLLAVEADRQESDRLTQLWLGRYEPATREASNRVRLGAPIMMMGGGGGPGGGRGGAPSGSAATGSNGSQGRANAGGGGRGGWFGGFVNYARPVVTTADGRLTFVASFFRPNEVWIVRADQPGNAYPIPLIDPNAPRNPTGMGNRPGGPNGGPPPGSPPNGPPPGNPGGGPPQEKSPPPGNPGGGVPGGPGGGGGRGGRGSFGFFPPLLAAAPDGSRIYQLANESISAWALGEAEARRIPWRIDAKPISMALRPDGAVLALGDRSGEVLLVSTSTGSVIRGLSAPTPEGTAEPADTPALSLAFSPGGDELAVGSKGSARIWNVANPVRRPELIVSLPGGRGDISSLAYGPEGRTLATAGPDGVKVWDLRKIRDELSAHGLGW